MKYTFSSYKVFLLFLNSSLPLLLIPYIKQYMIEIDSFQKKQNLPSQATFDPLTNLEVGKNRQSCSIVMAALDEQFSKFA